MKKKNASLKFLRCWEFFHCREDRQKACFMPDVGEWRCWLVNVTCCKMDKDAPNPLSIKKVICKNCDYFKAYAKIR